MSDVTTFLMFTGKAEEAMNFYVSLIANSSIISLQRYGAGQAGAEGSVMQGVFSLNGRHFMCTDSIAAHGFTFTPAMSLFVTCRTDAEITGLFTKLSDGGQILMPLDRYPFSEKFGWVADRYGVSWQLTLLPEH